MRLTSRIRYLPSSQGPRAYYLPNQCRPDWGTLGATMGDPRWGDKTGILPTESAVRKSGR